MINLTDLKALNSELESAIINFTGYHNDMYLYRNYYQNSAFYKRKSGDTPLRSELKTNMLKVFADKNIHYTSHMPTFKVPTTGPSEQERQAASMREKILYGVHELSGTAVLQRKWAFDGSVMSVAVAETTFDLKSRCARVKRYDPRYVFWQTSNDNEKRVLAFWAVFPITADECEKKYGFRPKANLFSGGSTFSDRYLTAIDGRDWFLQAIRWDDNTRVSWVGDHIIEEPHDHMMGQIPVDICLPFDEENLFGQGSFFLEPLLSLQAELNHTIKQRANIVQRMANPVVWGRNIHARQFDEVKNNLEKAGGGFVGLRQTGELGLLQVNDVKLLNEHITDLVTHMMKVSGYNAAAFGERVGANTSGGALEMYFTPTQRLIENQNIGWMAFYRNINAKILRMYDTFAKAGETFNLAGYAPAGTVLAMEDSEVNYKQKSGGGFNITFDKSIIAGNYANVVLPATILPKNDIMEKRFWLDAAAQKIISRTTAYENMGILSPEDELALITQEQQEPALNPEGTQQIMQSATDFATAQAGAAPQLPQATPLPIAQPAVAHGRA